MGKYSKAFEFYSRAVAMGDIDSILEVGLSLYYGIGTKRDQKAACKCFQQIVKAKPSLVTEATREDAYHMLGIASLEGKGVEQSITTARSFFERANKDEDHRAAQLLLTLTGRRKR
jgi:TPR repeat protein